MTFNLELSHRWSHTYSILSTCPFPSKGLLFAGTQDSKILVFDIVTYQVVKTIHLGDSTEEVNTRSSVLCLDKSRDEHYLFSGGTDSLVRVWSVDFHRDHSRGVPDIKEIATIYSINDIGDIFSLCYIDMLDTVVFGCQNASLLYLDNIWKRLHDSEFGTEANIERLPQHRYNKFFNSLRQEQQQKSLMATPKIRSAMSSGENVSDLSLGGSIDVVDDTTNAILEVPAGNIIKYAHNGFIYTMSKLSPPFNKLFKADAGISADDEDDSIAERGVPLSPTVYVVTGGGDGFSKLWSFNKTEDGSVNVNFAKEVELDNGDSVLSQDVEFPFLYCGLSEGVINIWDLTTRELVSRLRTRDNFDVLSLSAYKKYVFALSKSGVEIFCSDMCSHIPLNQGKLLSSEIFERITSSGGRIPNLLAGGNDGSLTLWDLSGVITKKTIEWEENLASSAGVTELETPSANIEEMLAMLKRLVSFETVSCSSHPTKYRLEARRCATYLQERLTSCGAAEAKLLPVRNGHNPVVFALFRGNAQMNDIPTKRRKRLLWYGHYDVVPAGESDTWDTDPFELTCENGYLKGRGTSDNKGPLVSAIHAVELMHKAGKLTNDIVFLIEGNEEVGSIGLADVCYQHKHIIGEYIDWIIFSNSSWVDLDHPCLNYGLRGVINAKIKISSNVADSHSGISGGILREPAADLFQVASKLQDSSGHIKIPQFYSALRPLHEDEYLRFKDICRIAKMEKYNSIDELVKNWTKPSLSLTALNTSGSGGVTVIPHEASVGLSVRLVPDQDIESIKSDLIAYVKDCFAELNSNNHLEIEILNEAEPWLSDPENSAYAILREEVTKAWGVEPLFVREGGSIPCIRTLERIFNAHAVQFPCGQSTDNAHLSNENLSIKNWSKMVGILVNVFNRL